MLGQSIRDFFSQLFGSKRAEDLRIANLQLRQDYDSRLRDKDDVILDLRQEVERCRNKIAQYEMVLIPLANPTQKEPSFDSFVEPPDSWLKTQEDFYRQQDAEAAALELAEKEKTNGV
jgi:hypothetical protein